ncbi:trihelix transcription factor GT-2-like [Hibiscus syriacus]|uniref:Trihelix transcription factor GT-2-like n=1 Tax=Hibiscus syriacus TaxID=106335 RepID=A0A6A2XHA7_HIBSY|nr:trihelix transcription factor GT-2-like [Hibiscus syriacus]KAE8666585.1 trihelix transcription factor GT-2-like [Hibiscus syriacus]
MGDSSMVEGSAKAATVAGIHNGSEGEEDKGRVDEGDRSCGGNRWPRQETLALLKIRSDMDSVFRDSTLKGPLWEEISRKLAELGYHRSAKKCKEKFENVYKYHKRTKDSRTSKADGKTKTYRFFDQLEAFQNSHSLQSLSPSKPMLNAPQTNNATVPSMAVPTNPCSFNLSSNLFSTSTSSSTTSNDDSYQGSGGKKRKWKEFFKRLTKEVIEKQEELQNKFLQAVEKCEQQRMTREEAWRIQEMTLINKEHEILVQERSKAAAKDAAVLSFLQKISAQQAPSTVQVQSPLQQENPSLLLPAPMQQPKPQPPIQALNFDNGGNNNNNNVVPVSLSPSPSRWPKTEIEALIKLRTNLDIKYPENGPKGPLWEEISSAMRNLGYNRSAKRCKEKWENINKYYKKVKENNKTRPEDSKTCPYFHQLDALYKEKLTKPDSRTMAPLMVRPEQQWPPQQEFSRQAVAAALMEEEADKENPDQIQDNEDDGDTEDEYEGNDFKLVAKTARIGSGGE